MQTVKLAFMTARKAELTCNPGYRFDATSNSWDAIRQPIMTDLHENPLTAGETRQYGFAAVTAKLNLGYSKPGPQGSMDNHDHLANIADAAARFFEGQGVKAKY